MTVGVFARPDHPEGWGFGKTAHGYVVLFVRCRDDEELDSVTHRLSHAPFYGIGDSHIYSEGALNKWFGGRFDRIATVPDVDLPYGPFQCRGDNRMVAVYDANDVLSD